MKNQSAICACQLQRAHTLAALGLLVLVMGCNEVLAQSAPAASNAASLQTITVTANPLGATELASPISATSGVELILRAKSTLGETLDGTPGISSTYFGPNASRPVIRGLDGDRIRILSNGSAGSDLSGLSFDHAMTQDPLSIERIEVLRGPATLQYGGSAVGGVVNLIDNRIPREPLFDAQGGVSARADASLASGNREQAGAVMLETGTDRYALHLDTMARNTQDVAVPIALSCSRGGVTTTARRLCNSASMAWGGALGGSLFYEHGYLGVSLSSYGSSYGTVAQDEVQIGMQSQRLSLEGEVRDLQGFWQALKAQYARNEYRHTEYESGSASTQFRTHHDELRLQARHVRMGRWEGVLGLQLEGGEFFADGSEVYAPYSRTRSAAAFVHEEYRTGWGHVSAGVRLESVLVESLGSPGSASFTPASRRFNPASYALGVLWKIQPKWQLSANLSASERAPRDYELFANGEHVATNAIEIGNIGLDKERSTNLDLGANWKHGHHSAGVQAFVNQFDNFISLEQSDSSTSPPSYSYRPVRARFMGAEVHGKWRLLDGGRTIDLLMRADSVRAENTDSGQPLPRIAPLRLGASLHWAQGPWSARLGIDQIAAQDRVPDGQSATSGYSMWNAALTRRAKAGRSNLLLYARLDNLGDTLAYSATSILTQTSPGRVPLPGRSLRAGLQLSF